MLSTATFHWILDHDELYRRLFAALKPGGRLVAQCGGTATFAAVLGAADEVAAAGPWADKFAGGCGRARWRRPRRPRRSCSPPASWT